MNKSNRHGHIQGGFIGGTTLRSIKEIIKIYHPSTSQFHIKMSTPLVMDNTLWPMGKIHY